MGFQKNFNPKSLFFSILVFAVSSSLNLSLGHAKLFKNSYISFELPDRWECSTEATEWICRSLVQENSKQAIIILTAKEVGPSDSLEQYDAYLKTVKTIPGFKGEPLRSTVKHVKRTKIAGHEWVDSLHLASELPSFYTRYLATTKQRIAILVTFSAHQRHFTKYSTDFFRAIQSLKVIATADLFQPKTLSPDLAQGESLGAGGLGGAAAPLGIGEIPSEDLPDEPKSLNKNKETLLGFGLVIAALGIYLILKRKKR